MDLACHTLLQASWGTYDEVDILKEELTAALAGGAQQLPCAGCTCTWVYMVQLCMQTTTSTLGALGGHGSAAAARRQGLRATLPRTLLCHASTAHRGTVQPLHHALARMPTPPPRRRAACCRGEQ